MKTGLIRKKFLDFFKAKKHKIIQSDTLVPSDDPTLLFTSAGMTQFKDYFLGVKKDIKRAASCQKCFRTGDIDNVGKTAAHHTFFEMLGNFSFGDYFKKEAISWAWEFMTEIMKVSPKDLWVSVYKDDDEAYKIWRDDVKVPPERIIKLGDKDNFWPAEAKAQGPNGPCGPCSEIFFDQGKDTGCGKPDCSPACDCDRFVEVWNLVFTQYNRKDGGVLESLPMKNIDTGMGLERLASVMQGVKTNFEIDIFKPIIEVIRGFTNPQPPTPNPGVNTIADHVRAVTLLISDGVLPSNEGRGYVERMVIRRAARMGIQLGIEEPFLHKIVPVVSDVMKDAYPELLQRQKNISQVVLAEEKRFSQTLAEGLNVLEEIFAKSGKKIISGEDAFKLYDTYGFPFEMTEEEAAKRGFKVDSQGFKKAMKRQREISRKASFTGGDIFAATFTQKLSEKVKKPTAFVGYKVHESDAKILAMFEKEEHIHHASIGREAWVVLDRTPFYGESGGQMGDSGKIIRLRNAECLPRAESRGGMRNENIEAELEVSGAKKFDKIIVHVCRLKKGSIKVGDKVTAFIDNDRRLDIARNHTATHLLHHALREVLGEHVHQAGSQVAPDRLRFDFTHFKAVAPDELKKIEAMVNDAIKRDDKTSIDKMSIKQARKQGAIALFGEKYEESVRVISVGNYSKELCGGTHLESTGAIENFKIVRESSISAGTRRIEAVTGRFVKDAAKKQEHAAREKTKKEAASKLQAEQDKTRRKELLGRADQIIKTAKAAGKIKVIAQEVDNAGIDDLRNMCDKIRSKVSPVAVLLGSRKDDKVSLALVLSKELTKEGLDAVKLIRDVSKIVAGGGGGRVDMAQAGGRNPAKLEEAFKKFEELIIGSRRL